MSLDKELLFKPRLEEADVEVPGVGTVRVRALSRAELMLARKATDLAGEVDGPRALVLERKMIATAMVDPALTEAEVGRWQNASGAGELNVVSEAIQRLSGMLDDAEKESYKSVRGESGS